MANPIAAWLTYAVANCTRFVAQAFSWIPSGLGDAGSWLANAPSHGLQTTRTPTVDSVAVMTGAQIGGVGHVGIVKAVQGTQVLLNDQNWDLRGGIATHWVDAGKIAGYILAPGMAAAGAASSAGVSIPNPMDAVGAGVKAAGDAIGAGITGSVTSTGHGLTNAISSGLHNLEVFASTQAVALFVAAIVVLVVFMS